MTVPSLFCFCYNQLAALRFLQFAGGFLRQAMKTNLKAYPSAALLTQATAFRLRG